MYDVGWSMKIFENLWNSYANRTRDTANESNQKASFEFCIHYGTK